MLAPGGDRLFRRDLGAGVHLVGLLPHLAETLYRAGEPAARDVGPANPDRRSTCRRSTLRAQLAESRGSAAWAAVRGGSAWAASRGGAAWAAGRGGAVSGGGAAASRALSPFSSAVATLSGPFVSVMACPVISRRRAAPIPRCHRW